MTNSDGGPCQPDLDIPNNLDSLTISKDNSDNDFILSPIQSTVSEPNFPTSLGPSQHSSANSSCTDVSCVSPPSQDFISPEANWSRTGNKFWILSKNIDLGQ